MSPADARKRSRIRWGGAIALLLAAQSLIVAALFWTLATGTDRVRMDNAMDQDCMTLAHLPPSAIPDTIRAMLYGDIHRTRFIAAFDRTREPAFPKGSARL